MLVHWQQKLEKEAMHAGVVRDMEQQRLKRERQADFEAQRELEQQYLKDQSVRDSTSEMSPPSVSGEGGGGGSST